MLRIISCFGDKENEYNAVLYRKAFISKEMNIPTRSILFMEQNRSDNVVLLDEHEEEIYNNLLPNCDAIITRSTNIFLAVRTADCYPVLFYDLQKGVIAVAHAGREGVRLRIIDRVIGLMNYKFGCKRENIVLQIGAGICRQHYLVSQEIADEFYFSLSSKETSLFLDLKKALIDTAKLAGIYKDNIICSNICTYEDTNYFSYRRDKTRYRQLSLIGMVYV